MANSLPYNLENIEKNKKKIECPLPPQVPDISQDAEGETNEEERILKRIRDSEMDIDNCNNDVVTPYKRSRSISSINSQNYYSMEDSSDEESDKDNNIQRTEDRKNERKKNK